MKPDTTSSLKESSGATKGVLDYGVLGEPAYVTWAGLMGHTDTRQKAFSHAQMGLSFAWMASLASGCVVPSSINRLCTALVPSDAYINHRV